MLSLALSGHTDIKILICILGAKSITFGFGKIADRLPEQNAGSKHKAHEGRMNWKEPAAASPEAVIAKRGRKHPQDWPEHWNSMQIHAFILSLP